MRFLHTSDWHVGRTIRSRPRTHEFAAVLDEVVAIARDQAVDAVLIAGDMFDGRASNPDAERLVFETLARLAAERIAVVAIPGNHDSAARWDALRPLLDPLRVRLVPFVTAPDKGSVVEIPARGSEEAALVACVPFVPERMFGSAASLFAGSERWAQDYAQGMGDLLEAMASAFRPHKINLLMAHLFATDVTLGGGENAFTVTLDYAVPPARFPAIAQYVALGHVHMPQVVRASPAPARYAGSLLQLDFGETEQRKSVAIVDVDPDRPASSHEIPLRSGRRLSEVSGTLDALRELAPTLGDAWLRVTVRTDAPVPGIADEVRALLPNAVDVRTEYPRHEEEVAATGIVRLDPREQYLAYYRTKHGNAPSPELLTAFAETYDAVRGSGGDA